MDAFWKAAAVILLSIILSITIGKTEKDLAVVLTITACCLVMFLAMRYLSEVIGFLWKLGDSFGYENPFLETLLKITGVSLMTEFISVLSADAGNSSLEKAMQILGTSVILFLSLPLFESFFAIIQEVVRIL